MAGPVEVLSMHPHALDTPPRTPYKGFDSLNSGKESPRKVIGKFPTDSSLGDVFYDPSPTSVSSPRPRDDSNQEIMPEDPFDSQHNRILFDAIDALQSFGAGDLSIPQLIIVGGQSSGKSSLLQSLTGIPFPVDSGCCTRFPTRIVSRRTEPDSDDSFRINYECSGKILTKERFAKVIDEISSEFMGLRTGLGEDRKNFVAEVLKIELSGPHRSYFSILDLPGTFQNASAVNETDQAKVEAMVKEYMNNEDNIVICVIDAPTDFDRQEILRLAKKPIKQNRFVGVFTKCDMIVSIATGNSTHSLGRLPGGWFLVRNRADKDPDSFDLSAAEKKLFSKSPWNSVSQSRLGSTAAKSYLGTLLSSKIRDCFPTLRSTIQHNLEERQHEKTMLGEPRTSHAARQQFVVATVRKYEEMAQTALDRPGFLDHSMELRREVSRLNAEFDKFMRARGGTWEFEDAEVDPRVLLDERLALETQARAEEKQLPSRVRNVNKTKLDASLDKAFPGLSTIQDTRNLMGAIQEKLALYQGSLLDGIINPDIYPDMYREQVKKWGHIANIHLARVAQAVNRCTASILNDVCPAESDTSTLSRELTTLLEASWKESMQRTEDLCKSQCEMETKCVRLQSTGPRFGDEIHGWRILRFYEGFTNACVDCDPGHLDLPKCFESVHPSLGKNMVLDVHDVLKVYYKLSLDAFIRTINNTVIESFISGQDGPVLGLNTNRILSLSEDEMKIVGGENENTARRRKELEHDIEKLQGALTIVDRATRQTSALERN
ncbi:Dynamin-related protein 1D [Fusarium oxysporum f. sp. cubense race 1]|uniref:Dynamin-related protein 1D n=1 Tax=Fusarium oxysporum f. sp. cubense (strain race 1) TaxID=1229664 RepID=N4U0V3_FUSC1|nr:Dynamin-related protein 1D [Fusarium oxysporum f. sp. cubense race 1]